MTDAPLFHENGAKPALDWVRDALKRRTQAAADMRRLREQHVRWVAGIATGGIALIVASWSQLTTLVHSSCLLVSIACAVLSIASAAATTAFSIDVDETGVDLDTLADGFLAACGQVTREFLDSLRLEKRLASPEFVQALAQLAVYIDRPRAAARLRLRWAYRFTVFWFCLALAALLPGLLARP